MQVTRKINILLVDDRPENLLALEAMLESLGENLVKATSGREALKCVLDQDFAVILLDVQMPDIDGFETAALIRGREKSRYTPIIFLTAIDRDEEKAFKGYSVGAVDYLFKPLIPEVLKAKVSTFVELFRKTEEIQRQSERIEAVNRQLEVQLQEVKRLNWELEAANTALRHSENLYRTLARNLPRTAIFLFDHRLHFLVVEDSLADGLGVFGDIVEGSTLEVAFSADGKQFWMPYYQAALNGIEHTFEERLGERFYFVHVLPVKNEQDEIFAGLGVIQDITELKQAEEALRETHDKLEMRVRERTADLKIANEELSSFTYIVSHDLRSPLINLKGFAAELRSAFEVVRRGIELSKVAPMQAGQISRAIETEIPEALDFIESAVTRMNYLTDAILKLSRVGRRELRIEPVQMESLVQSILNTLAHQIKEKQARIMVSPLPTVLADRIAMEQIMGNILANAVHYLNSGRPGEIAVWAEQTNIMTVFHVRDNGRGIAEEDYHKVFEPFRRVGRQDVPGEGMGLAYVQTLVRRHGGQIWFVSELGVGTTFSFTIPTHLVSPDG